MDEGPRPGSWLVASLVAVALALIAGAGPASAQDDPAEPALAPTDLELVSQTPFVAADGELVLRVALGDLAPLVPPPAPPATSDAGETGEPGGTDEPDPAEGAAADEPEEAAPVRVLVTVYGRLLEANELDADLSIAINRLPDVVLTSLPIDDGVVTVRLPVRSGDQFDDVDRMLIPDAGVYPVTVELREGDTTLGSLRTEMIRLPTSDEEASATVPVTPPVAVVLPVGRAGPSVATATELLADHPDVAVTPIIDEVALAELEADSGAAAALVAALGDRTAVVATRPNLDVSSLASIGRLDRYRQALAATRASAAAVGLPVDEATITLGAPQTAAGAAELTDLGIRHVVHAGSLTSADRGPSRRVRIDDTELFEFRADPAWTTLTADELPPAARTQRLLAQLALADAGAPILLNAAAGDGGGATATLDALFAAFASPSVGVTSLAELASRLPADASVPAEAPAQDLTDVADFTAVSVALLGHYAQFHVSGVGSPSDYESSLDTALAPTTDPSERVDRLVALNNQLELELSAISLPENQPVTLAAQSAQIPLTIENTSSGARLVLLSVRSDKITVAQDGELFTIEPGTSSIELDIETRSLGGSPLQVALLTPDGQRVLSTTRFDVRSTAIPGIGLLISAIGLLLLGGWWYVSIRRRRSPPSDRGGDQPPPDRPAPEPPGRTDVLAAGSVEV